MLDAICQALPEWNAASADLREIRSDVVCSLENVETILKEFISQQGSGSDLNQFVLEERNRLKQDLQNLGLNENVISQIYTLVMGYSSVMSSGEKLKAVTTSINQLLSQLHVSSFKEIFVWHYEKRYK